MAAALAAARRGVTGARHAIVWLARRDVADVLELADWQFREGIDPEDATCRAVAVILEVRIRLDGVALSPVFQAIEPVFQALLDVADTRLAPFERAVLLLSSAEYAAATAAGPVDIHAWWGLRAYLGRWLSDHDIAECIAEGYWRDTLGK